MVVNTFNFTTGVATLPDVGALNYNGCTFSPLFETYVAGAAVKDNAQRTVKFMDYTIAADGYVTLPAGATSTAGAMATLRNLLSAQGGSLVYQGRGCDIVVNPAAGAQAGASVKDVAWGPVPDVLEFQPLGGGLSAKIKWVVKIRIPEIRQAITLPIKGVGGAGGIAALPLIQFNYETVVSYGEDGYSSLSVHGTAEVAMTRTPNQTTRILTATVDDIRTILDNRVLVGIDLTRFRVARRSYSVSRDKRTLEWDIQVEEIPYMQPPPDCTVARGTYSFRQVKAGAGLCNWLCTLRATYTVRGGAPRRIAWFAFLALLRERMRFSTLGRISIKDNPNPPPPQNPLDWQAPPYDPNQEPVKFWEQLLKKQEAVMDPKRIEVNAWLIEFSGDEGLYLDSKTTSFSATWRLVSVFDTILTASGMWEKVPDVDARGSNLWTASVRGISGSKSWLQNRLDPKLDVIVDFGGG